MDRNEQNLKEAEFKTAMQKRDFEKAVEIADTLDLKKMKDNNLLSLVADAYEMVHKYQEAKRVLLLAYENTNAGRQLAYRLCLITIKTKEYDEAMEFYGDFVEMAPRDTSRYILRYKIAKAKGEPVEKLIDILEEYVNIDMEEKWAYGLAKLYHLAGDEEKCIDMCDEISLWFSEGKYVVKAMELKKKHRPLTSTQEEKYKGAKASIENEELRMKNEELRVKNEENQPENEEVQSKSEEIQPDIDEFPEIDIESVEDDKFNTMNIQEVIADGIKDIIEEENVNLHEEKGATKVAPGVKSEELRIKNEELQNESEELQNESEELREENEEEQPDERDTPSKEEALEEAMEHEPINDVKGVEDILRQLQEKGILKAETVAQAVNIIDGAIPEDLTPEEKAGQEENTTIRNNGVIQIKTVSSPENEELRMKDEESLHENEESGEEKQISFLDSEKTDSGVPVFDLSDTDSEEKTENDMVQEEEIDSILHTQEASSAKLEILSGAEIENEELRMKNEERRHENEELRMKSEESQSENEELRMESEELQNQSDEFQNENEERTIFNDELTADIEPEITLNEEELSAFKNYLNVEGFESNIREVLQELIVNYTPNGRSETGNVIIMGDEKTGKTTLAVEIIKLVNKKRGRRDRKLAKVNAMALNRRGFRNSMNKLLGSDLIIENANQLGPMIISEVVDVSGMYTDDMLIILEGETEEMSKMLEEYPKLSNVFNHVVQIREYNIKEWVEYAAKYAKEQGYGIDELANLACYKAIDDFFGTNKGIAQSDVEGIVDGAIAHSKKLKRKFTGLFSTKKNEDGLYILVESDFNN